MDCFVFLVICIKSASYEVSQRDLGGVDFSLGSLVAFSWFLSNAYENVVLTNRAIKTRQMTWERETARRHHHHHHLATLSTKCGCQGKTLVSSRVDQMVYIVGQPIFPYIFLVCMDGEPNSLNRTQNKISTTTVHLISNWIFFSF